MHLDKRKKHTNGRVWQQLVSNMKSILVVIFCIYVLAQFVICYHSLWEERTPAHAKVVAPIRLVPHNAVSKTFGTAMSTPDGLKRLWTASSSPLISVDKTKTTAGGSEGLVLSGPITQSTWMEEVFCSGKLRKFGKYLAVWKDMTLNKSHIVGRSGGESLHSVMGIREQEEFLALRKGTFKVECIPSAGGFVFEKSLNDFISATEYSMSSMPTSVSTEKSPTILLIRYEYANVYWTIIDLYNAYLTARNLNLNPKNCSILLFDGHPSGHLDALWKHAFGGVLRLDDLKPLTQFKTLIWQHMRYHTPLLNKNLVTAPPYLNEFQSSIKTSCGITQLPVSCSKLFLLFIWRHNYVAHARNPKGMVKRKVSNEEELIRRIRESFPNVLVEGHQLDNLTICSQIEFISRADFVVAMHGAALAFTAFMKPGAGLIEIYPPSYTQHQNWHMTKLAEWKNLYSMVWKLRDKTLENRHLEETRIPPHELIPRIKSIVSLMCHMS